MRTVLSLFSLCVAIAAFSLKPIQIVTPDVLVSANGAKEHPAIWKALKKSDFTKEQLKMIVWYGRRSLRPKHLQDRFYEEERPYFANMKALEVLRLDDPKTKGTKWALVMIPGPENQHLPKEIRPVADLYLVIPQDAYITEVEPWTRLPSIWDLKNGPSVKGKVRYKLNKPKNIYGLADLRTDEAAQTVLKAMLEYRDVKHVELRCNETYWPTSMNSMAERKELIEEFKKYKAYALAEFDGKILLIVPAAKNQKIARRARPIADIYLLVDLDKG